MISLLRLFFKIKCSLRENHFCSFICFFSCFLSISLSPHVFVKEIRWQMTKHVIKINEWRQWWEWSPSSKKGGLLLFFSAWLKVWVDGPESTKENASGDYFMLRLAPIVCFLVIQWLVCDTDSPRDTRQWVLSIISSCSLSLSIFTLFMFTLLP